MNNVKVKNLIVVGDRVLIEPKEVSNRSKSGLLLPVGVKQKEEVQSGIIIRVGPGFPIPADNFEDEWKPDSEKVAYVPLQAMEGDTAIYLMRDAYEIQYEGKTYFIVPHSSILLLERDDEFFNEQ